MDEKTWAIIKAILAKGDRVELIPAKDSIKIMRIRRENIGVAENENK